MGRGGRSADHARPARWRTASAAAGAVVAAGAIAAGIYVAVHPGGAASHAAVARRPHEQVSPRPAPRPLPPLRIGTLDTYRVVRRDLIMARPVGRARRRLRVTLRYPAGAAVTAHRTHTSGLFPLLLFAPGFRQCARSYSDLLREWSSAGYVVAAVDFPLTSCRTVAPTEADLVNQPADLAYVLQRMLAASAASHGGLSGLIAPGEVAVAGHSDGGDTVAAMAGTACCRNRQVRAVVVLAGAKWPAFGTRWFTRPAPPILFVQGTADTWNFPAASLQLYRADAAGRRYYLDLPGADHFAPYEGGGTPEPIVAKVSVDFFDRYLLGQRARSSAMWLAAKVAGSAILLSAGHLPP